MLKTHYCGNPINARAIVEDNKTGLRGTLTEWARAGFYVLTGRA